MRPDDRRGHRAERGLQIVTLLHVAALVVFATWDFGGETDFASSVISWWGSLALLILVLACMLRWKSGEGMPGALPWLLPPLLFNLLVIVSALNPSFTQAVVHGTSVFMRSGARPGWPSTARPLLSLRALWQFDAIFLTCFNLAVVVVRQRVLRWLLFVFTVNGLALAVMGTFQKLAQATGLYFGAVPSPNPSFFASFIYHNHWGAFTVLATSAALGLLFHHARERDQDDRRHSPVFFAFVSILFIAASVPLSASRSCTVLLLVLLTGALLHWLHLRRRQLKTRGGSFFLPAVLSAAVFAGTLGAIYILGKPTIEERLDTTRQQIGELRSRGDFGSRQLLYADTWHMAGDKLCFGWGLGTYATVFPIYNSQYAVEPLLGQTVYARAHSDWLQAVAEVGLAGTLLLLLTGLIPLAAVLREHRHIEEVPRALLAGCGLIGLYAWVEFPFANPAVLLAFWLCFFAAVRYHKLAAQGRTA